MKQNFHIIFFIWPPLVFNRLRSHPKSPQARYEKFIKIFGVESLPLIYLDQFLFETHMEAKEKPNLLGNKSSLVSILWGENLKLNSWIQEKETKAPRSIQSSTTWIHWLSINYRFFFHIPKFNNCHTFTLTLFHFNTLTWRSKCPQLQFPQDDNFFISFMNQRDSLLIPPKWLIRK